MNDLSSTTAAREHARAQGRGRAEAMPTIPPTAATDLPDGVIAADVVWDEVIGGGGYSAKEIARGTRLRLVDLRGEACAGVLVHNARMTAERLNVADTVKVQWQAYLGAGALLLSDQGRALMTIVADTSGTHDAFCGCSCRAGNDERYGAGFANGRDSFAVSLAKFGLSRRDIHPNVTFFKGVRVDADGGIGFVGDPQPGAAVDLVAEMDVLVTMANTPHVLDPRPEYTVTPLRVTAWTSRPTAPGSEQWVSSPERERAYRNTGAWLAGLPGR